MTLLFIGVLTWIIIHLFPVTMVEARRNTISRIGEGPYKALFAVGILLAIAFIILGWRSATPVHYYLPPAGLRHPAMLLVVIGFIFLVASKFPNTRLRRFIRHPQLTGVHVWAFAHLLANGDNRSLVLFGGMFIWTLLSIILINRRDGRPETPAEFMPVWKEALIPVIAIALSGVIVKFHYYLAGVPLIPTS